MAKRQHPADRYTREQVAKATEFSVYQYRHRDRFMVGGIKTLARAAELADQVERDNPARPCLIYAYTDGVGHPVPNDLRAAASAQSKRS